MKTQMYNIQGTFFFFKSLHIHLNDFKSQETRLDKASQQQKYPPPKKQQQKLQQNWFAKLINYKKKWVEDYIFLLRNRAMRLLYSSVIKK